jgi:hypothetical protein
VIGRLLESGLVAILALFGVQMFRTFLGKRKIRGDFDYAMQVVAKEAVRRAKSEHGVDLDFGPASIERLEAMLGSIHEGHLKHPLTEKELSLQSIRWGAYIGEMLKRVRTGKWQRDSEQAGRGTMPVVFDSENEAFPCSWAYKRIADGPDDNVIFKFQVLCDLELRKHVGSMQAVIVEEPSEEKE